MERGGSANIDLDISAPFIKYADDKHAGKQPSAVDEEELIKFAKAEMKRAKSTSRLNPQEKQEIVNEMLSAEGFAEQIARVMQSIGQTFPSVEIHYKDLTIETDALVGSGGNPSVGNSFKKLFLKLTCQGGLKTTPYTILHDVKGVIKPGRLTLLLGPPGGGKSVLLQTLAGRLRNKANLRISGEVTYNGFKAEDFVLRRTAGLVNQLDNHIPELTVLETVTFASNCQLSKEESIAMLAKVHRAEVCLDAHQQEADVSAAECGQPLSDGDKDLLEMMKTSVTQKLRPYITLRILGLETVADTAVGSAAVRGVSGGQRKRVTTAELLTGPQWLLLMDEISTGLDSATTFSVVQSLRNACHAFQRTIFVSLLQPQPEVLELFDDVVILTDGQVIYHGPVAEVLPFYKDLGFECPARKDPASFLQEITTPLGQHSYATDALMASKKLDKNIRDPTFLLNNPPKELIMPLSAMSDAFWKESAMGQAMMTELSTPITPSPEQERALAKTKFANPWYILAGLVFKRSALLMRRMRAYFSARIIQTVIMSLVIASLYARIVVSVQEGRSVLAMAALSATYLSMINTPQMGLVFSIKSVLLKHRDNNYFPMWSYVLSNALNQLPPSTVESVIYSVITYWIAGLTPNAGNFFLYLGVLWSTANCLAALFQLIAYLSPSMVVANAFGSSLILLMMITNGFSILRTSIPPYLIWFYWINPLSWSIRALCVNELSSARWGAQGQAVMDSFAIQKDEAYVWGAILYLWGLLIIIGMLGSLALKYSRVPEPQATVSEEDQKKEVGNGLTDALKRRCKAPVVDASRPPVTASPVVVEAAAASGKENPAATTAIEFTPITLVCRDIQYFVADPSGGKAPGVVDKSSTDKEVAGMLQLLHGIDFYAEPGDLTALMGGSGAGKTTLMDVVAGRKTQGVVRGEILVNGRPKIQQSWARVVGYVEQNDIHTAGVTVRESLIFSARLRLDEKTVGWDQVMAIVEDTLDVVELRKMQHSIVGEGGGAGLSGEQRKRLSIAVELVANPSVMFADEPTSGLDARAAQIVMRSLRRVADSGRCVLVTIHQPSIELFEVFDQLVLMQKGGRLTYFGPLGIESCDLISYLESKPGVTPIKPGHNPSTWMLEVTGGSTATTTKAADLDFPTVYAESEMYKTNATKMDELVHHSLTNSKELTMGSQYACSHQTQAAMLAKKFIYFYWRSPHYNYTRIMIALVVGLLYGITYLNQGDLPSPSTVGDIQNLMGVMFSMSFFLGMFNAMTIMPIVAQEREVFYRERAASMYGPLPYNTATGIAELPYLVVQATVLVTVSYFMIGFQLLAWKFFYFLLIIFGAITLFTFFGHLLIVATPQAMMGQLLMAFFSQLFTYFNGFLVPYPQMPEAWKWMNRVSPSTWIIYGLASSQLGDRTDVPFVFSTAPDAPPPQPGSPSNVAEFMTVFFGYDYGMTWWCVLIVFSYALFFRLMSATMLSYVNYQKR